MPLLVACNRDDSTLNDYDLFGRLQRGNGTWEVISITTRNNTEKSPVTNDATLFQDEVKRGSREIQAEPFRVVFPNGQILGGEVWTVTVNKANTQVWTFVDNSITTTMTLERSKCDIPENKAVESGG